MSSNPFNAYELLDVPINATQSEIIKAFKLKAQEFHPDKNCDSKSANVLFTILVKAKELLLDPEKRLAHDYAHGIKEKPRPKVETVFRNETEYKTDWGSLLWAGIAGLAIGAAAANVVHKKSKKQVK